MDYTSYITKGKYRVVRYADDFLIFAKNENDIRAIPDIMQPYLEVRGLTLAEDKTSFTTTFNGFDFLGFNVKIENTNKCIMKPSKDSMKAARHNIGYIFNSMNGHNVGELIDKLNPVIEGIAEYWKPMVSSKAFKERS